MSESTSAGAGSFSTDLFLDNRYVEVRSIFDPHDVRLREMAGTERIGEPFSYDVKLISRNPIRDLAPVVGSRMTVGLKLKDGSNRYFNGLVFRFRFVGIDDTRRTNYVAEVRPWLTLLKYRQNCRVFQNKTALDIIKAIFAEHPSARFRDATRADPMRVRPLCVQWNETDFAFVSRLMEQEGIYYYFEHSENAHEMVLVNDLSAQTPCPEDDQIETHLNLRRAQIHNDMIFAWHEVAELQPEQVALNDYDYEKPQTSLLKIEPVPQISAGGTAAPPAGETKLEIYNWPGDYRQPTDGSNYARIRAQEISCRKARVRLETNARNLVPGHTFNAGNPFDRTDLTRDPTTDSRYLLLGGTFSIVGETGAERRAEEAHFLFSGTMEALLATTQYRPPRHTPCPVIAGPQTALVVGAAGEDITTDRYGCIKVQFYWDREGKKDENSSCFIRVAQNWAGRGWGGLVTPRVGQEAVVQFINGDPDWPIITGTVYNASNMPPYELPSEATRSTFKTRSSVGPAADYNEFRFEDKAGSEEVYVRAQKDLNGDVLNNLTITTGSKAKVTAKGSTTIEAATIPGSLLASSVEVESAGLVTVTCSTNIALKVGPAGVPVAQVLINEAGITMIAPTINLVAEDGEINMSGPPIFPPV
jgi:type VI secretion system secreted protein VgrG